MRNMFVVFRREYLERVRSKAFIITTVLMPVIFGAIIGLPIYLATRASNQHLRVAVVENAATAARLFPLIERRVKGGDVSERPEGPEPFQAQSKKNVPIGRTTFELRSVIVEPGRETATREGLQKDVLAKRLDGFLWIEGDPTAKGRVEYDGETVTDFVSIRALQNMVSSSVVELRLRGRGVQDADVEALTRPVDMKTVRVSQGGSKEDKGASFVTSYFFVMLLYITLILYGVSVMRSIIEEKSSRIFEVLLGSAKPMELLGGKILGIAGVGLTQYAVWTGLALIGGSSGMAMAKSQMGDVSVPITTLVFCVVFFILGYLLYSTMYAALGAMVNSDQEGQQLQLLIVQFLIVPMLLMMPVLRAPNGTLATVLSLIPFYTPILMLLRISLVMPPVWQVALSIALLLLTNLGVLWVSARIYRVGILMYGKRPTLPELVRWVRAA